MERIMGKTGNQSGDRKRCGFMQSLAAASAGEACTVKWMFGIAEILGYLRKNEIKEGEEIRIVQNYGGNVIVSTQGRQFAVSKDIGKTDCEYPL